MTANDIFNKYRVTPIMISKSSDESSLVVLYNQLRTIEQSLHLKSNWVGLGGLYAIYDNHSWHLSSTRTLTRQFGNIFEAWYYYFETFLSIRFDLGGEPISTLVYCFRKTSSENQVKLKILSTLITNVTNNNTNIINKRESVTSHLCAIFHDLVNNNSNSEHALQLRSFMNSIWCVG